MPEGDFGRNQIQAVIDLAERAPVWRRPDDARVAFELAARQYADANIAAIPLGGDNGKKPLVNGPKNFGVRASLKIAPKFSGANVGFWCGQRSGVTVVDVDDPSGRDLRWALEEFGLSPIIVRTGSGKYHIWYRHAGERRHIRPFRPHEVDILGGGIAVAPPSIRPGGGAYEFVVGGLADVPRLPPMRKAAEAAINQARSAVQAAMPPPGAILEGSRNASLFDYARSIATNTGMLEVLENQLLEFNASRNFPPLGAEAVRCVARSVWRYKVDGRLWLPGTHRVALDGAAIETLTEAGHVDALALLALLKRAHPVQGDIFAVCPAAMERARCIGSWSKRRYREAVRELCRHGFLERIAQGGRRPGDPAQYRFPAALRTEEGGAI